MKSGTFLWAMEQLIAGKKIARKKWDNKEAYYKSDPVNAVVDDRSIYATLAFTDCSATDWIIWHPPVNYIPGTFPWAWEQLKAGKKVKRPTMGYPIVSLSGKSYKIMTSVLSHSIFMMEVSDINATDWEVVE